VLAIHQLQWKFLKLLAVAVAAVGADKAAAVALVVWFMQRLLQQLLIMQLQLVVEAEQEDSFQEVATAQIQLMAV
jgi:hypothetical protein